MRRIDSETFPSRGKSDMIDMQLDDMEESIMPEKPRAVRCNRKTKPVE